MFLPDGTVCPSYLSPVVTLRPEGDDNFGNLPFREGTVTKVLSPDPENGIKVIRYIVEVQHRDSSGRAVESPYVCKVLRGFGSPADRMKYTLRPAPSRDDNDDSTYRPGSKVLVACVNGEKLRAYIIGGIDDQTETADSTEAGHNLDWEFNGVSAKVNKDGELVVTMKGPTKFDGTPTDEVVEENVGTTLTLTKDGSVTVAHGDQKVFIDHPNKKIAITGTEAVDIAAKQINVKGDTVVIADGNEKLVKGSTFRNAQAQMHTALQSAITAANTALAAAATACTSSGVAAPAAPGFTAMVAFLTAMQSALSSFEGASNGFLSNKATTG